MKNVHQEKNVAMSFYNNPYRKYDLLELCMSKKRLARKPRFLAQILRVPRRFCKMPLVQCDIVKNRYEA